jgi:hypothetical protein
MFPIFRSMWTIQISDTIHSFSKLGMIKDDISEEMRNLLLSSFEKSVEGMNEFYFRSAFYRFVILFSNFCVFYLSKISLGKMKFSWEIDFRDSLRSKIIEKVNHFLPGGDPISVTSILYSLTLMKYNWKNGNSLEEAICQGIIICYHPTKGLISRNSDPQYFVSCIRYLGRLAYEKKNEDKIIFSDDVLYSFWNGIEFLKYEFSHHQLQVIVEG